MRISLCCVLPVLSLASAGLGQANQDSNALTQAQHAIGVANLKTDSSIPASESARTALASAAIVWPTTSIANKHTIVSEVQHNGEHDHGIVSLAAAQASTDWAMTSTLIPTVSTSSFIVTTTAGSSTFRVTRSSLLSSVYTKYLITEIPVASQFASTSTSTVFVDEPTIDLTSTVVVHVPTTTSASRSTPTRTRRRTRTTTLETTLSSTSTVWAISPTKPSSTQTLVVVHDPTSSATSSSTVVYVITPVVKSTSTIVKTVSTATFVLTPKTTSSFTPSTSTLWVDPTKPASITSSSSSSSTSTVATVTSKDDYRTRTRTRTLTMTYDDDDDDDDDQTRTRTSTVTGVLPVVTTVTSGKHRVDYVTVITIGRSITTASTSTFTEVPLTSESSSAASTETDVDDVWTTKLYSTTTAATPLASTAIVTVDASASSLTEEPTTATQSVTTQRRTKGTLWTNRPWNSTNTRPQTVTTTTTWTSSFGSTSTTTGTSTMTWTTSWVMTSTTTMTSTSTATSTSTWTSTRTAGHNVSGKKSSTGSSKKSSTRALQPNVYGTSVPDAGANERLNPGTNNRPLGKVKGTLGNKAVAYPNKIGKSDCKALGKKCKVADDEGPVRSCFQVLREHMYSIHVKHPGRKYGTREKIACAPGSSEYCAFIEWEAWTPKGMRHSKVLNEMQQPAVEDGQIPMLAIVEAVNWIKSGGAKLCGQTLLPVAESRIPGNGSTAMQVGRYVLKLDVKVQGLRDVRGDDED